MGVPGGGLYAIGRSRSSGALDRPDSGSRPVTWTGSAPTCTTGGLDTLFTGVVAPLSTRRPPPASSTDTFFLRHGDSGPHMRLRLRPARREHAGPVRDRVRHRAAAHFAAHPSTPAMSTEVYRTLAAPSPGASGWTATSRGCCRTTRSGSSRTGRSTTRTAPARLWRRWSATSPS
ncbi:lantibiotic dehydratase C-terminal domain-containing protein [Dactylosporangium sp. NBC_01737]|uniref:lantibiotic dehydratase C-terminal domain-containing protein n=1 Tax=Dactylosporangium sp. NBC_01737 TaxID=2975959 RepID=UPI003FA34433